MKLYAGLIAIAIAAFGISTGRLDAAGNSCTGSGRAGKPIVCSGSCADSSACTARTRQIDGATAAFCGCASTPNGWACCYLLQWTEPGGNHLKYFVLGDCPACGLSGGCQLVGNGSVEQPFTASCVNP